MQEPLRLLFVCDSDSNIAFSTQYAAYASRRGAECQIAFCASKQEVLMQAAHAKAENNIPISIQTNWRRLFESVSILDYDVIFVMISGKDVPFFCDSLRRMAVSYGRIKPKTIGGFIGEWISGEGQVSERTGLDVFVVNREEEVGLFKTMSSRLGFGCRFVHVPYGFVVRYDWARSLPKTLKYSPSMPLLFAEQVQIPRSPEERRLLFRNLVALANAYPEREILFCEREVPGGATLHRSIGTIDEHFDDLHMLAPNLIRRPGGFRKALKNAQFVLSVSSTACIEALVNGIPALFIEGFHSSGADKFAFSGLRVPLPALFQDQELTISDSFYGSVGEIDGWDKLYKLVNAYKRPIAVDAPCVGTVLTNTSATMTARGALFESLGRIVRPVATPVSEAAITFAQARRSAASTMISDNIVIEGRSPTAETFTVDNDGNFEIGLEASAFCLHLNMPLLALRKVQVNLTIDGADKKVEINAGKLSGGTVAKSDGEVELIEIERSGVRSAVLRLAKFRPMQLLGGVIRPERGFKRPPSVFAELSAYPSNPDILARRARVGQIPCSGDDICIILSPADWRSPAPGTRIFSLASAPGGSITIDREADRSLTVQLPGGTGEMVKRTFPSIGATSDLVIVFATKMVAAVMVNQNLLVANRDFTPASIGLSSGLAEVEACFDTFDVFAGRFTPAEIDRVIELVTLRLFGGEEYADRHTAIPDFRAELEVALGIAPGGTVPTAMEAKAAAPKALETKAPAEEPKADKKAKAEDKPKAEKAKAEVVAKAPVVAESKPKSKVPAAPVFVAEKPKAAKPAKAEAAVSTVAAPAVSKVPEPAPEPKKTSPVIAAAVTKASEPKKADKVAAVPPPSSDLPPIDNVLSLTAHRDARQGAGDDADLAFTPASKAANTGMGSVAPPESQLRPIEMARMALDRGNYEEVVEISTRAIHNTPTSSMHMLYVALAYEKLGRVDEALSYAKRALTHRPNLSRAHKLINRLGNTSAARG